MLKKVIPFILIAALLIAIPVFADDTPTATSDALQSLTFNGIKACCEATIISSSASISATMQLWYGSILIKQWTASGTGIVSFNETWNCISGRTYTLKVSGTINGTAFSWPSVSATC